MKEQKLNENTKKSKYMAIPICKGVRVSSEQKLSQKNAIFFRIIFACFREIFAFFRETV